MTPLVCLEVTTNPSLLHIKKQVFYGPNEGEWWFVCTAIDVSSLLPAKTSAIGSFLPPVTRRMLLAICPINLYVVVMWPCILGNESTIINNQFYEPTRLKNWFKIFLT